jgi:RNA polymerase sigma-70 factor (ECF subfamily)
VVDVGANSGHANGPGSADPAFEAVFRANYDDLVRYALRRIGPDNATDVVAEAFLVAWRRRGAMPAGAERVWLFGVVAHLITNERRGALRWTRLLRRASAEPVPVTAESIDPADTVATSLHVRAVLATLPPLEQEALRLTEWEQLDIGEAATVAGCSRATFRVRLHRARRRFRARLSFDSAVAAPPVAQPASAHARMVREGDAT